MSDHSLTLSSGRRLVYAEYGDPHGTPLFYFHGWPSSRLQGEIMHDGAIKHGLRVIAPDRPGIGRSEFQPGRRLLDWPPVIEELAARLGVDKFYLMGVSGGGPYVLATTYAMPDRVLGSGVCCGAAPLWLVGTKGIMWTYLLGMWTQKYAPWALGPGLWLSKHIIGQQPEQWPLRMFLANLGPEDRRALQDIRLRNILNRSGVEGLSGSTRGIRMDGNIFLYPWGFELSAIQKPVHFWHGGSDRNMPLGLVQRLAALLPNAITHWYPEDGHYSLPLLRTEEMTAELVQAETPVQGA